MHPQEALANSAERVGHLMNVMADTIVILLREQRKKGIRKTKAKLKPADLTDCLSVTGEIGSTIITRFRIAVISTRQIFRMPTALHLTKQLGSRRCCRQCFLRIPGPRLPKMLPEAATSQTLHTCRPSKLTFPNTSAKVVSDLHHPSPQPQSNNALSSLKMFKRSVHCH